MKQLKKVSLLMACMLLACALMACSGSTPADPAPTAQPVSGTTFSDQELGISFLYPEGWILVDEDALENPEFAPMMEEKFSLSMEEIKQALVQSPVMFYDTQRVSDTFRNNMNLVVTDTPGMSQVALKALKDSELRENLMPAFEALQVTWVEEPTVKKRGDNLVYFSYAYNYELSPGLVLEVQQISTANKNKLYTITYTGGEGTLDAAVQAQLQGLIDTLQFI